MPSFFLPDRFIHSIKTAIAVLIGFILTKYIHLPVDQWLIITILVVMCAQLSVGSVLQKSYMRFLGTLVGSLIAALTLAFFGDNHLAIGVVIALSAMFFSFIATSQKSYNEAGTLGAVTVTIILIGQHPTITTAAGRFFEISVGILIAALMSQFIFPAHARKHLRETQARTIRELRDYYIETLIEKKIEDDEQLSDEMIVKSLIIQRKLAMEAAREPIGNTFKAKNFSHLLWCEKEILRSMIFMHHAYRAPHRTQALLDDMPALKDFNQAICETLTRIANDLDEGSPTTQIPTPNIEPIKNDIFMATQHATTEQVVYLHSFLFCAETLVKRIHQLIHMRVAVKKKEEAE